MPRLEKPTAEYLERYRIGQRNEKGKQICGAKNRRAQPCGITILCPNGRCRGHGGKSLSGIASPSFVNGRRSRVLPGRLMADYEAGRQDPDLIALRDDIALTDARLNDVLGRVDTGESGNLWRDAKKAYDDFKAAGADLDRAKVALAQLGDYLQRGAGDWAAWEEIGRLIEQRRKLVDSEHKRLVAMQQMMTQEKALAYFAALAVIVRDHVQDQAILSRIQADFDRFHRGGSQPAIIDGPPAGAGG